jgi:branched-chain amino acid transport system permease protein
MSLILLIEQILNGLQFGIMLFLMAAGLTLIFGVMGLINLAHGSLYMIGAFCAAAVAGATGSFLLGLIAALAGAAIAGALVELVVIRRLYTKDHLDQVLATFALILIFSEGTRWLFGSFPLFLDIPDALSGPVTLPGGIEYPLYRLALIIVGLLVAAGLFLLISRTRLGIQIRAGENDREMIAALGVDIAKLYTIVFALGAALAGLAGALVGAIQSVQVGMGEPVLILAFVVIVIGGIGSIKGALIGAILVGLTDTLGGIFLPELMKLFFRSGNGHLHRIFDRLHGDLHPDGCSPCVAPNRSVWSARMTRETMFNSAALAALALVPLWAHFSGEPFTVTLATRAVILALAAVGLHIALGLGGLVSLGHAVFFGIGGYAMGILAHHAQTYTPLMEWPFVIEGTKSMPVIWLVAVVLSSLVAYFIGLLSLQHFRRLLHHDHAGLRADVLFLRDQLECLWR